MRQSAEHEQIVTIIDSGTNNYGSNPLGGPGHGRKNLPKFLNFDFYFKPLRMWFVPSSSPEGIPFSKLKFNKVKFVGWCRSPSKLPHTTWRPLSLPSMMEYLF
jgi:hypothetical protein